MRELARIMENQLDARMIIDIPAYFANGKRKTKFIIKISPCYVCFLFFVVYHQDAVTDGYVSIIIRISVIINARKSHNVRILASFIVLLCCLANCMLRKQETTCYTQGFDFLKWRVNYPCIEVVRWQTARRGKTLLHLFYCVFLWFGTSFHWRSVKSCWDSWLSGDEDEGMPEFDGINFTLRTCKRWVHVYIWCWSGMLSNGDGFHSPYFLFGSFWVIYLSERRRHLHPVHPLSCHSPEISKFSRITLRNYSNKNTIK